MKFILSNINLDVYYTDDDAVLFVYKKYEKFLKNTSAKVTIFKKSVDARKKDDIHFCFSFLIDVNNQNDISKVKKIKNIKPYEEKKLEIIKRYCPKHRPIVIGAGPAGLFCAYFLAKNSLNPIVIERGDKIEDRDKSVNKFINEKILDEDSNIQFGEGGAGAFSDGKLMTRISDPLCSEIIETLSRHSGIKELLYQAHPHIGTDKLKECVKNLREEIIDLGGEFHFNEKMTDLIIKNGKIEGVKTNKDTYRTDDLIVASGHSAKDVYKLFYKHQIKMEQKSFSVGVRIEHKREDIDFIQYRDFSKNKNLGAAEYSIFHHLNNGHTAYSFCMCPGGTVVAAQSEKETVIVNGMSEFKRDGRNSNSAICISVSPSDFGSELFDGLSFIEEIEKKAFIAGGKNYKAPVMTIGDFLKQKEIKCDVIPTYPLGVKECDFKEIFPTFITDSLFEGFLGFENKMKGFTSCGAILTAAETRTSAPLKVLRNENFESPSVFGLYPCGEGAGMAGGIVSAAVDGAKAALKIISKCI